MTLRRALSVAFLPLLLAACAQTQNTTSQTIDHPAAEAYIRSHISELSPQPAVLGGTFYVTDIQWQNDDTALVSYEDGHIALKGTTVVSMKDAPYATTLSLLPDEPSPKDQASSASSSSVAPTGRPKAGEGEFCGGLAGIQCEEGLTCRYDGTYPDAGGTCVR
jgi:hypothetical protein